jgi:hypothetical protein
MRPIDGFFGAQLIPAGKPLSIETELQRHVRESLSLPTNHPKQRRQQEIGVAQLLSPSGRPVGSSPGLQQAIDGPNGARSAISRPDFEATIRSLSRSRTGYPSSPSSIFPELSFTRTSSNFFVATDRSTGVSDIVTALRTSPTAIQVSVTSTREGEQPFVLDFNQDTFGTWKVQTSSSTQIFQAPWNADPINFGLATWISYREALQWGAAKGLQNGEPPPTTDCIDADWECTWSPDGITLFLPPFCVFYIDFVECCKIHDKAFWCGGNAVDLLAVNSRLGGCIAQQIHDQAVAMSEEHWYCGGRIVGEIVGAAVGATIGAIYFAATSIFGAFLFNWSIDRTGYTCCGGSKPTECCVDRSVRLCEPRAPSSCNRNVPECYRCGWECIYDAKGTPTGKRRVTDPTGKLGCCPGSGTIADRDRFKCSL